MSDKHLFKALLYFGILVWVAAGVLTVGKLAWWPGLEWRHVFSPVWGGALAILGGVAVWYPLSTFLEWWQQG